MSAHGFIADLDIESQRAAEVDTEQPFAVPR
jgi:hypothetical protein